MTRQEPDVEAKSGHNIVTATYYDSPEPERYSRAFEDYFFGTKLDVDHIKCVVQLRHFASRCFPHAASSAIVEVWMLEELVLHRLLRGPRLS